MKTKLTIAIFTLVTLFSFSATASADNDRPIQVSQFPTLAQQTISKHFNGKQVALAKLDNDLLDKSYDIIFTDGCKVEFDSKGNWTEIVCPTCGVPAELVPAAITQYVKQHYASKKIHKIERSKKEYEVELNDGMEITFNTSFQVTDIDR